MYLLSMLPACEAQLGPYHPCNALNHGNLLIVTDIRWFDTRTKPENSFLGGHNVKNGKFFLGKHINFKEMEGVFKKFWGAAFVLGLTPIRMKPAGGLN